jgi:hypothetical protein
MATPRDICRDSNYSKRKAQNLRHNLELHLLLDLSPEDRAAVEHLLDLEAHLAQYLLDSLLLNLLLVLVRLDSRLLRDLRDLKEQVSATSSVNSLLLNQDNLLLNKLGNLLLNSLDNPLLNKLDNLLLNSLGNLLLNSLDNLLLNKLVVLLEQALEHQPKIA